MTGDEWAAVVEIVLLLAFPGRWIFGAWREHRRDVQRRLENQRRGGLPYYR